MKTKKLSFIFAFIITSLLTVGGIGLVAAHMYQTVLIDVANAQGKIIQGEFLLAPKKIACLNYDSVDILDKLGLGHHIVGMIKGPEAPKHLQKYVDDASIVPLGSMKEPDMQALASLQPHVILSSGRTVGLYDSLVQIAPTMAVAVDSKDGFLKGVKDMALKHGILMGKEKEMKKLLAHLELKAEKLRQKHEGRRAIQAIFVGDKLHIQGAESAKGKGAGKVLIADLGFENAGKNFDSSNAEHSSYEYILAQNPEFIFVLDKNSAVGNDGAKAKEMLPKQEQILQTEAFKTGKLIFLNPENTWYVNSGGLTAMDSMLQNFTSLPKKDVKPVAQTSPTATQETSPEQNKKN